MRCFLAVPVRDPALALAQQVLRRLRDTVAAVRWARPETLHVTIHFFGNADDAAVARALDAVAPVAAATRRFELTLDALGAFPERGSPRVLWLGTAAENREMVALAAGCRDALRLGGFEVEARPFRAHCTLGRPRVPWPAAALEAWHDATALGVEPGAFTADALVLFESAPARGGAIYTERALLPLAG